MLDVYYPTLCALIQACKEIRKYLRSGESNLPDTPEQYNIRKILDMYTEEVWFDNGIARVAYRAKGY